MNAIQIVEFLEHTLFPISALVTVLCVLLVRRMWRQYRAVMVSGDDPDVTESMRRSVEHHLQTAIIQLAKVVVIVFLSSSLFLPTFELITNLYARMVVLRGGLLAIILLILLNTVLAWRYWEEQYGPTPAEVPTGSAD